MEPKNDPEVWCLLGLPFYAMSMQDVCGWIRGTIQREQQGTFSVTNVNWIVLAAQDPDFKQSVLLSDVNAIDSRILFWCARFLGLPLSEQIAGPAIIEALARENKGEIGIYFFGGERGAARNAAENLNKKRLDLYAAGFGDPGFGSVEQLRGERYIEEINRAAPDFLMLSIGAKKGLAWIQQNKTKLKVPIISYLGAVVNLVAGRVKRAPPFLQKAGLEWLWRIFQEPKLLKRCWEDGPRFLKIIIAHVLPLKVFLVRNKKQGNETRLPAVRIQKAEGKTIVAIKGICNRWSQKSTRRLFCEAGSFVADIEIDLSETEYVDSSFLGEALLLWREQRANKKKLTFVGLSKQIQKIFRLYMVDDILKGETDYE